LAEILLGVLDVVSVGMNNKARALCATSCLVLGACFSHGALAQSATSSQGSTSATALPGVEVQGPKAKPAKPKGSPSASRSQIATAHSQNTGHGGAASAAA